MLCLNILKHVERDIKIIKNGSFERLGLITDNDSSKKILVFIEDPKYVDYLKEQHNITSIICNEEVFNIIKDYYGKNDYAVAISQRPKQTFFALHNYLYDNTEHYERHDFPSEIGENSIIHPTACIAERGVKIGRNCVIEANTVIHSGVEIGDRTVIRSHCTIGGEGFQFTKLEEGFLSVKHAGKVVIGSDVQLYPHCVVDKGVLGTVTFIGNHTKIDCLSYIAHGAKIGEACLIGSHTSILGRVKVGDNCKIGPGSVIRNGIIIGDRSTISPASFVTTNVKENEIVSGYFAVPHTLFLNKFKEMYNF